MRTDRIDALASIHDVEPRRLDRVLDIVDLLESAGHPPAILLLVPGAAWSSDEVDRIRELQERGWMLGGHGWCHRARAARSLYHRVHAAVLSRDQAEHLSRSRRELLDLVEACHAWFGRVDLPRPELYVPPAWAMGALSRDDLGLLPFRWYETLSGVLSPGAGGRWLLPLVGYEADTRGRELGLRAWNRLNEETARMLRVPVRMAIHPDDLHLRLAHRLRRDVRSGFRLIEPRAWLTGRLPGPRTPGLDGPSDLDGTEVRSGDAEAAPDSAEAA